MRDLLVGSTGFVGGNIARSHKFDSLCHSSDIKDYYGFNPDLCVYAGVPAAMYLANVNSEADLQVMADARESIRKINPKKLVLISSIAVYKDSKGKNEESAMDVDGLSVYGKNRLQLEQWVREDNPDALIVRLPALYGDGIKKNFLYDLHSVIPAMLSQAKYDELCVKTDLISASYSLKNNGFYCLNDNADKEEVKRFFENNDFNAISFTDSRSIYQFYNLNRLWGDISKALSLNLNLVNLCTPPVSTQKVYSYLKGSSWTNELAKEPFDYDLHSKYSELLGGEGYYLCTVEEELEDIKQFMNSWEKNSESID